jgi:iron(III) transport system permease protein
MGGALRSRLEEPLSVGFAAGCLVVAALSPLAFLAGELVSAGAIDQLGATLGTARTWLLLARSIGLALAVTALAMVVGIPLGVLVGKTDVLGRRAALIAHAFPLFLPPFLLALGWFHLFSLSGTLGSEPSSNLLFGPLGVIGSLALAFAPIVTILTGLGLQGIDPSLEEAGRTVTGPVGVVMRILLPLAWPSIALAALVVFALALSEIGVPMFLRVRTYSAAVFTRLGGIHYAPGEAVALVAPLLLIGGLLVWLDQRIVGRRSFARLGARSRLAQPMALGRLRVPASGVVWMVALASLLPLAGLALRSGASGVREAQAWIGSSLSTSLIAAAAAATVITAVGLFAGYALARRRAGGSALDAMAVLAFMTPSAVLGVGLIAAWNRPGGQLVYGTVAIIVIGLTARYALIGTRMLAAIIQSSSPHYEEAAAAFGAGFARRLSGIVVPMHARAMIGAWLVAFVFCMRDLDAVIVFYPPGLEPLTVRIFTLEANGPERVIAALSLLHAIVIAAALSIGGAILRRRA